MNAKEIRALGCWGSQGGLLSVAELDLLMSTLASEPDPLYILEVGHYYGLSTCGIMYAAQNHDDWRLDTVDAHIADPWVPNPAPTLSYERNKKKYFHSILVNSFYMRSQEISPILPYDAIFYDGDHGLEQLRFTRMLMASRRARLFIFDDRDFEYPARCAEELKQAGWVDGSPTLQRLPGDKTNSNTMTLGIFRR
jgi:hypothetical protein